MLELPKQVTCAHRKPSQCKPLDKNCVRLKRQPRLPSKCQCSFLIRIPTPWIATCSAFSSFWPFLRDTQQLFTLNLTSKSVLRWLWHKLWLSASLNIHQPPRCLRIQSSFLLKFPAILWLSEESKNKPQRARFSPLSCNSVNARWWPVKPCNRVASLQCALLATSLSKHWSIANTPSAPTRLRSLHRCNKVCLSNRTARYSKTKFKKWLPALLTATWSPSLTMKTPMLKPTNKPSMLQLVTKTLILSNHQLTMGKQLEMLKVDHYSTKVYQMFSLDRTIWSHSSRRQYIRPFHSRTWKLSLSMREWWATQTFPIKTNKNLQEKERDLSLAHSSKTNKSRWSCPNSMKTQIE